MNQPIIKDPQYTADADYVIMESTYGDRCHKVLPDYVAELARLIQETFDRGRQSGDSFLRSGARTGAAVLLKNHQTRPPGQGA